jgi:DNA mismatch repair protein MutL
VKQALGAHHVMPIMDFSLDVNFQEKWDKDPEKRDQVDREYSYKTYNTPEFKQAQVSGWEKLFEGNFDHSSKIFSRPAEDESEVLTFPSRASQSDGARMISVPQVPEAAGATFQVELSYIVAQTSTGLLIVDQQAAHERVLYDRYSQSASAALGASQQCLFPPTVQLGASDFCFGDGYVGRTYSLGFMVEEFGKDTVVIHGVPADIQVKNEKELFEGLLEQFKNFKNELSLDKRENLARSLARKSALKKGQKLNSQEMETWWDSFLHHEIQTIPQVGTKLS